MVSHLRRYDTLIIGAGAAGLAAAQKLQAAGQRVLILEARDRIGGRVWSDYRWAAHPVELGAEFVHGDVVTRDLAETYGLSLQSVLADDRGYIHSERGLQTTADYAQGEAAIARDVMQSNESAVWEWADTWVMQGKPDTDVATLVKAQGIELPSSVQQIVSHTYSADYGVYWDQLGVHGLVESTYEGDGCEEYRIVEGYGELFDRWAADLKVALNHAIARIDWRSADDVEVTTTDGLRFQADRLVITLPLAILQREVVEILPALPDWKQQAIAGLGLSSIIKLVLQFDAPFWPEQWEHCHTHLASQLWWRPGFGSAQEAPILTAFVGAAGAEWLRSLGELGAINVGLAHLANLFDCHEQMVRDRFVTGKLVDWCADPYAQMGYSYTPVNGTGLRAQLAAPIDDRLFFAGEATSVLRPATVHGAIESGWAAAGQILQSGSQSRLGAN
jgi:monoamine oxidase